MVKWTEKSKEYKYEECLETKYDGNMDKSGNRWSDSCWRSNCQQNSEKSSHSSISSVQFSSVAQSCPTLCDPVNRSTPGLPLHHQLPEFTQTHIHRVGDAISSFVIPFSSCPQSLSASESFPMSQLFAWGGQSTGVSSLASFLPKNTQGWSALEWTGWISLQSKGLSRVFSNTTV